MWIIDWTHNPATMEWRSCKTYFISVQLRFMEKLLIIFLGCQQHRNIKENPKCTNFYSPSPFAKSVETQMKIQFNIKYSARAAQRMNGDNLGTIRRCVDTLCTLHTHHSQNTKTRPNWARKVRDLDVGHVKVVFDIHVQLSIMSTISNKTSNRKNNSIWWAGVRNKKTQKWWEK